MTSSADLFFWFFLFSFFFHVFFFFLSPSLGLIVGSRNRFYTRKKKSRVCPSGAHLRHVLVSFCARTMVQNKIKKHGISSHPIIHCPMSERMNERSGAREQSEASKFVSGAIQRVNGRASGPVLQSILLAVLDHSARMRRSKHSSVISFFARSG